MAINKQATRTFGEIETEVVLQQFADRVLVIITQLGKVGCFIQATIPSSAQLEPLHKRASPSETLVLPKPPAAIELSRQFGVAPTDDDDLLYSLYASQVATLVWTSEGNLNIGSERRPVLVGIGLRRVSDEEKTRRDLFMGLMEMILELLEGN